MITASLVAENTFCDPIRVGVGQVPVFTVKQGTTDPASDLDAVLTAQFIMDTHDPSRPASGSTSWTDMEDFTLSNLGLVQKANIGDCWFRVGIKTGNYTGGQADIILKAINEGC